MENKQDSLAKARLYVVLDRQVCDYAKLFVILKQAVRAGVDVVQLRDKISQGREVLEFARIAVRYLKGKVPLIINDRVDLAIASGASGVHLGQGDMPVEQARRMIGDEAIIGVSCQTLAHVRQAQKDGADYVGWGSVFKTFTKPSRQPLDLPVLAREIRKVNIPVFAIGGITLDNVNQLTAVGINKVALTRAICLSSEAGKAIRKFRELLGDAPPVAAKNRVR